MMVKPSFFAEKPNRPERVDVDATEALLVVTSTQKTSPTQEETSPTLLLVRPTQRRRRR